MADGRKLSSLDASFLYLETPEMPMHVGSMAIFRLPDDYKDDFFEAFKAMIAELYGKPENLGVVQFEAEHNYNRKSREAVYAFFGKQVLGDGDARNRRPAPAW